MANETLNTTQAAERLGVCRNRILNMIYVGRLKASRVGYVWMIAPADLEAVKDRKPGKPRKQANA